MSLASTTSPVEEVVEFFAQGPSREEIAGFRLSDGRNNDCVTSYTKTRQTSLRPSSSESLMRCCYWMTSSR